MPQDRRGHPFVGISREPVGDFMRHAEHVFDDIRQCPAHADAAVAHQGFEDRKPHAPQLAALIVAETRADDLARQQTSNPRIGIVAEDEIGLTRRCRVFGDCATDLQFRVFGQEIQQLRRNIGTQRQRHALGRAAVAGDRHCIFHAVYGSIHGGNQAPD